MQTSKRPSTRVAVKEISLEQESIETIVKLKELSPAKPVSEPTQKPKTNLAKLLRNAERQLKEVQAENLELKEKHKQFKDEAFKQLDIWQDEFNHIKRKVKKTRHQRAQLMNVYKQNLMR